MANLKPREFYPDFHVNIRKDGRVNGVEPVTLKDMGLPYDLDYPEQPVGELPKKLYENLVEEFIFLIDELLPRDIQDLFYKATLDPRRAYWKLFEEAARRMQLPYYFNCHRDEAKGCYPNISDGIRGFIYEGRTLADIYLNTCVTRQMILEDIDYDYTCLAFSDDENEGLLFPAEFALFKMSIYNYKRDAVIPGSEIKGNLVLFSKESEPELVMMEVPEEPDYVPLWDDGIDPDEEEVINNLKEKYEKKIAEIKCVEDYCAEHNIPFLKFTKYQAMSFYESGKLGQVLRDSINNPAYAKEFLLHIDDEEENLTEPENIEKKPMYPEGYLFEGKIKKLRLESNGLCYGPVPMPSEETEQRLTINSEGRVWLTRDSFANGIIEKTNFKANEEAVKNLLEVVASRFSRDHELHFVTDIGSWEMILTNEEGKEFRYSGPMMESTDDVTYGLSDMTRRVLGRDDLFIFDGCPDKIDNIKIEYSRETKIKPKELPEGTEYEFVTWSYSEILTIDRATETLTNHIQFAEQCSVTNTYHVEEGISSLLDDLWPEMFEDVQGNPPEAIDDPMEQRKYKITVITNHGDEIVTEGTFDKLGLPDEYPEFIEKIYDFMSFYGIGELFERKSYEKTKRTSTDYIFCDVEFEPGGKTYCYLADDDTYEVGDTVLVPAGHDNHEALVRIVDKNYYSKENAPFPVDKAKWIIKRIDEDEIDEYLNKD